MFKRIFFNGLLAGIFGTIISTAYILIFKYSPLEVDFTEKASLSFLLSFNMILAISACFIYFACLKLFKKENLTSFIVNFILSGASIALALLFMFTVDTELKFKNENAELYKDFYYFILAPVSFFPTLSWFTFKPLLIK
ncbi:MAG: hypothetical protein ACK5B9_02160 [Flavobacteriia bacterium]|jgi:hypothetical protein